MDLDSVGSLTGTGEVLYYHLDNSCRDVVANLVTLMGNISIHIEKERHENAELQHISITDRNAVEYLIIAHHLLQKTDVSKKGILASAKISQYII